MSALSRRTFVKDAGGLLIGFSLVDSTVVPRLLAQAPGSVKAPSASRLDAWLRIEQGGSVQVFTGKLEIGMGVDTALTQIVAEELDLAPARVKFVFGDKQMTVDQGGVPVDQLQVRDGVVTVRGQARQVTYGELAADMASASDLKVTGAGFALNVDGGARPKDPATYTVVGTSVP